MLQKIATRVFMGSSLAFGVTGILFILSLPGRDDNNMSDYSIVLQKILFVCVFVILPSFALSVATKYLNGKS